MGKTLVVDVPKSNYDIRPLLVGAFARDVVVQTPIGDEIRLSSIWTKKPTALIFYRGGWCPYCNRQLSGLRKIEADLSAIGFQIVAISPDKPEKLRNTIASAHLAYTLLSDKRAAAARSFGIAFKVDDETLENYQKYNIDIEENSGATHHVLPVPSVFILGTDGRVNFQYVNPEYKIRLAPSVLLAAAIATLAQ